MNIKISYNYYFIKIVVFIVISVISGSAFSCFKQLASKSVAEQKKYLIENGWMITKGRVVILKFKNAKIIEVDNSSLEPIPDSKQDNMYFDRLDNTGCFYRVEYSPYEDYDGHGGVYLYSVVNGDKTFIQGVSFTQSKSGKLIFSSLMDKQSSWFHIFKITGNKVKLIVKNKVKNTHEFGVVVARWLSGHEIIIEDHAYQPKDSSHLAEPAIKILVVARVFKKKDKWIFKMSTNKE